MYEPSERLKMWRMETFLYPIKATSVIHFQDHSYGIITPIHQECRVITQVEWDWGTAVVVMNRVIVKIFNGCHRLCNSY